MSSESALEKALHASAPPGTKCADCSIDGEACLDCYAVWWKSRHPNVQRSASTLPMTDHNSKRDLAIFLLDKIFAETPGLESVQAVYIVGMRFEVDGKRLTRKVTSAEEGSDIAVLRATARWIRCGAWEPGPVPFARCARAIDTAILALEGLPQTCIPERGEVVHVHCATPEMHDKLTAAVDFASITPTPMILQCPQCAQQHIDKPDPTKCKTCGGPFKKNGGWATQGSDWCCPNPEPWTNPPHKTHRCAYCNHTWQPFDFPTYGVTKDELAAFIGGMSDGDWDAALSMAHVMVNTPEAKTAAIVGLLTHDKFEKIGTQMNLWAKLLREPNDDVDHVRLCFVDTNGAQYGDSIRWDHFLKSIMRVCGVADNVADLLIGAFKHDHLITVTFPQAETVTTTTSDAQPDPVHQEEGKWYFWEETWADKQGPYETEAEARSACEAYARTLAGEAGALIHTCETEPDCAACDADANPQHPARGPDALFATEVKRDIMSLPASNECMLVPVALMRDLRAYLNEDQDEAEKLLFDRIEEELARL